MTAPMSNVVTTTIRDGVAVIAVDYPPVNALGPGVPAAIAEAIGNAEADPSVSAIVFMGAGKTFVAGADINSLDRAAWGDRDAACDLHPLLARIEDCAKPVVMAIHDFPLRARGRGRRPRVLWTAPEVASRGESRELGANLRNRLHTPVDVLTRSYHSPKRRIAIQNGLAKARNRARVCIQNAPSLCGFADVEAFRWLDSVWHRGCGRAGTQSL